MSDNQNTDNQNDQLDQNLSRLLGQEGPSVSKESSDMMLQELRRRQVELYGSRRPDSRSSFLTSNRLVATAAVVAALGFVAFWIWSPGDDDESTNRIIATLVSSDEPSRITLDDGTVLICGVGTKYEQLGKRHLRLGQGKYYLRVEESAEPFRVRTKDGDLEMGESQVYVHVGKETLAAVGRGQAKLKNDFGSIDLHYGHQGTIGQNAEPSRGPAPRFSYLVSWSRTAGLVAPAGTPDKSRGRPLWQYKTSDENPSITLRKYHVDVVVENGIARTTIDQTFFNHQHGNAEGTFYFPLPPGASVSRLAMYVAGKLNEGGMVERTYGQQVYNEIKYQNRDPALLEKLDGNLYKLRIFPMEGRQEKRILLSFTQSLPELYGTLRYWFPMDHTHDLADKLSIKICIKDGHKQFAPESSTHRFVQTNENQDIVLQYNTEDATPNQDILLHLRPRAKKSKLLDVATVKQDGHTFSMVKWRPELQGEISHEPRQWIVLRDASASQDARDWNTQQQILRRWQREIDHQDRVYVFDVNTKTKACTEKFLAPRDRQLRQLFQSEEHTRLGATNLTNAWTQVAKLLKREKCKNPHVLFIGDGIVTDGTKETDALVRSMPEDVTFIGIGVGKSLDSSLLQSLADKSGGMYVTIQADEDVNWRVLDLVSALNTPRLIDAQVRLLDSEGQEIKGDVYVNRQSIAAGESLAVTVRHQNRSPQSLKVVGKIGDKAYDSLLTLPKPQANATYLPRLWAQQHLAHLQKSGEEHKAEMIKLSQHYYVLTPFTSLIVLEDDKMYQQYGVEKGRKDHWALYPAPATIPVVHEPLKYDFYGPIYTYRSDEDKDGTSTIYAPIRGNAPVFSIRTDTEFGQRRLLRGFAAVPNASMPQHYFLFGTMPQGYAGTALWDTNGNGWVSPQWSDMVRYDDISEFSLLSNFTTHDWGRIDTRYAHSLAWGLQPIRGRYLGDLYYHKRLATGNVNFLRWQSGISFHRDWVQGGRQGLQRDTFWRAVRGQSLWFERPGLDRFSNFYDGYYAADYGYFQPMHAWGAAMPVKGMSLRPGLMSAWAYEAANNQSESQLAAKIQAKYGDYESSHLFINQGWEYRPRLVGTPTVTALTHVPWICTSDLTRFAPMLHNMPADLVETAETPKPRTSDRVRQLVKASREKLETHELQLTDGQKLVVGSNDRVWMRHVNSMSLAEEMICDGESLWHRYDELGLTARRKLTPAWKQRIGRLTAHVVPSIDALEQVFEVELVRESQSNFTLKLKPRQADEKRGNDYLLLVADKQGRLERIDLLVDGQRKLRTTFRYSDAQLTIHVSSETQQSTTAIPYRTMETHDDLFQFANLDSVTLDFPLLKPEIYGAQLEKLEPTDKEERIRLLRHQALSSLQSAVAAWQGYARQPADLTALSVMNTLMAEIKSNAYLGDVTLHAASGAVPDDNTLSNRLNLPATHPFRLYFRNMHQGWKSAKELKQVAPDSLLGHLGAFVAATNSLDDLNKFVEEYPNSPLCYSAVKAHTDKKKDPKAWLCLAKSPQHRHLFLTQAPPNEILEDAKLEIAAEILEADEPNQLLFTPAVANLLRYHKDKRWKAYVNGILDEVVKSENLPNLLRFIELCESCDEKDAAKLGVTELRRRLKKNDFNIVESLAAAETLWAVQQESEAWELYQSFIEKLSERHIEPSSGLLGLAACLAHQAKDVKTAIKLELQSIAKDENQHYANMKSHRLNRCWQAAVKLLEDANAKGQPAEMSSVVEAMIAGKLQANEDPTDWLLHMATFYRSNSDPDREWQYVSTVAELNPRNTTALQKVAQWHSSHADWLKAAEMYGVCDAVDPANPHWLLQQGDAYQRGKKIGEARRVFQQVLDTKWAPGLQRTADQAKQKLAKLKEDGR